MKLDVISNRRVRVALLALLWLALGQPFLAAAKSGDVGRYTQNLNGQQATLDLSKTIFVSVGLSYSF
jgi:hypothetical protein